jgi:periplasmic copper chaperone A
VTICARLAVAIVVLLGACSAEESPSLAVSDVTAYAALPGQAAGVAYFSLQNSTPVAATLRQVSSPEFSSVEIHMTLMDDGIARMTPLDLLTVAGQSVVVFAPGGPHLMLMQPVEGLATGDEVTLEFHYDYDGNPDGEGPELLTVRTPLLSR